MRKKIYNIFNKTYSILMTASFFAGILPLIPFIVALIIGGDVGEQICVFIKDEFYPWVILVGSISIVIGLIGMYIAKIETLSIKKISAEGEDEEVK